MILVDEPTKRRMCPVTIFLSLALADGVIKGVRNSEDLTSPNEKGSPVWSIRKYTERGRSLSVLRRASNRTISLSRGMKPNTLQKIMYALVERAGHQQTLDFIQDDNKRAARREKQRLYLH